MDRRLHVALLTPNLTLGGAERWVVSLARHFDPKRVKVTGVAISGFGGIDPLLRKEIQAVAPLHSHGDPTQRPAHARVCDTQGVRLHATLQAAVVAACRNADVLVGWGDPSLGYSVPEWLPLPVVLVSHTTATTDLQKPMVPRITHCAAVSEAAAGYFLGRPDMNDRPVTVVYNGAETDRLRVTESRAAMRRQWGIPETAKVMVHIGRLSPEKNPGACISTIPHLPDDFYAVHYGTAEQLHQPWAAALRHKAGLYGRRVVFCDPIWQIGNVLNAVDVVVLASQREAFSLVLLEAWLCGVPVVATPVGSVPELERQYGPLTCGVRADPTPRDLANAVRRAVGAEGQRLAVKAKAISIEQFTATQMAGRWTDYLRDTIGR